MYRQRDVLLPLFQAQVVHAKQLFSGFLDVSVIEVGNISANHLFHDFFPIHILARHRADQAAVPENGDPVCQGFNFIESVGDVDNRHTLLAQLPDFLHQTFHFPLAQDCGRLVKNDDLWFQIYYPGDVDHLPDRSTVFLHRPGHINIHPKAVQQFLRHRFHLFDIEELCAFLFQLMVYKDIPRHTQIRNQHQLLMNCLNSHPGSFQGACQMAFLAVNIYLARGRLICAENGFDQRGFPCAVFTAESMNFTSVKRNIDIRQSMYARETFVDMLQLNDWCHGIFPHFCILFESGAEPCGTGRGSGLLPLLRFSVLTVRRDPSTRRCPDRCRWSCCR